MKIQNISSGILPVAVSFMTAAGESISVTLKQGDFVYTDSNIETKSIVILMKKRHIKTSEENKPDNISYFQVCAYGTPVSESSAPQVIVNKTEDAYSALEKYKGQFKIPSRPPAPITPEKIPTVVSNPDLDVLSDKVLFPEKVEEANKILEETTIPTQQIAEQVVDEPTVVIKNKGGRPKGSKDTIKRGEPKLKKPAGRPINTNALQGKNKDEVIAKCKSRGYDVRITNEDGRAHIVTHDLRLDRVELQVENGIVTKANIG